MLPAWDNKKGFIRSEATGSVTLIASHTPGQQEVLNLSLATYERLPLYLGLDKRSGRTCSCTSMAICVRAQTEGVRKQGQSPEARTMKVHHSILLHRTDCYHFPLARMYTCVRRSGLSIKPMPLCPWVSRRHGVFRTCRGLHLTCCVWRDLPHFRP